MSPDVQIDLKNGKTSELQSRRHMLWVGYMYEASSAGLKATGGFNFTLKYSTHSKLATGVFSVFQKDYLESEGF